MSKVFLSIHVLAAILAVGPVAVAASMFPAALKRGDRSTLALLHRICRVYAWVSIAVPVFGFAVAGTMKVTGQAWVLVSIALTAVAAVVLLVFVLPGQRAALGGPSGDGAVAEGAVATAVPALDTRVAGRLAMTTGVFNLLWAVVTVLMIVRPGSSTGV
ncbi:hypothetical protein VSH64_26615 [Amycolatopsis rhabdoformis]|uniref:DUF2269 family protein n=1 Tax=Amycolatopsis rhabdoformis TaxID=1448059 RepID=A0ABZ1HW20_9PSEU|nr:hypothetical protein [Amycolatopsis rhabdoformis]WSE26452.1 hypothetical protein VSH64_26615 [Amycolatopsis rhabdoformis]